MLLEFLWPKECALVIDRVRLAEKIVLIEIRSTCSGCGCPDCGVLSQRVHSRYARQPADLPVMGYRVRLIITVRRFFCDERNCFRTTFAERIPSLVEPYARRTTRLAEQQLHVAFATGGESGARLLALLAMPTSPDSLLRLVQCAPEPEPATPRVLGIDDWAKRRGLDYGAILIDLETQQRVDILPDATAETIATWLREHPGVEIVSRDRGNEVVKGVQDGAPDAIPVADRWHLLKNVRETAERWLESKRTCLKAAAETEMPMLTVTPTDTDSVSNAPSPGQARRIQRYEAVRQLFEEGTSQSEIARRLHLDRKTVRTYLRAEGCPSPALRPRRSGKLDAFEDCIRERWLSGGHNAAAIFEELREMGFRGGYTLVKTWIAQTFRGQSSAQTSIANRTIAWSARRASWLLMRDATEHTDVERHAFDRMTKAESSVLMVYELIQRFVCLIRERRDAGELSGWIEDALASGFVAFRRFAKGLTQDSDAVRNALELPWSNGQVEGQVNRLKLIKRQMYGRAGFELLRKRFLGCPATG